MEISIASKVTGIILAGGKSTRMGTDKGVVEINGKKIIQYVIDVLKEVTDEIIIVANNDNYNDLGYKVYHDIVKDCGPIGGIYSGLFYSKTETNIVLSCDTPLITKKVLESLLSHWEENELVVSRENGFIHPLCALYKKCNILKIKKNIDNGNYKLKELTEDFKTKFVDFNDGDIFSNLNSRKDIEQFIYKIA